MNARLRPDPLPSNGRGNSKPHLANVGVASDLLTRRRRFPLSRQMRNGWGGGSAVIRHWAMPALLLVCALCSSVSGQFASPQTVSARGVSGQFFVYGAPPSAGSAAVGANLAGNENYLKLEPALTAVSCERIKHALAELLGDDSPWRGRIHLVLYPAQSADDGATIVSERFRDGWSYRLELPDPIARKRFVRAVVQALLLEQAGRKARDHSPEVPAWLAEGLTQHLLMANERQLFLPPPQRMVNNLTFTPTVVSERWHDPLETARRILRERPPLTLAELSWPANQQLDGPAGEAYRCSAQLFIAELLRLKDGRACLRAMLDELATCYNWQTAFLRAFHTHFERQVDLEKWWALQLVHFTGRDPAQTWSSEESWRKLDEVLRTPVEVRHTRDELPGRAEISLAAVIHEWDFIRQSQTLRTKLRGLDFVRLRVSQDLVVLVDDYRRWLAAYLDKRDYPGMILPASKIASPGAKSIVREALKQLSELESRREAIRPRPVPVSPAQVEADPAVSP